MELLVVVGLLFLAAPLLAFIAFLRTASQRREIEQLQHQMTVLSRRVGHLAGQLQRGEADDPDAAEADADQPARGKAPSAPTAPSRLRAVERTRPAALRAPAEASKAEPPTEEPRTDHAPGESATPAEPAGVAYAPVAEEPTALASAPVAEEPAATDTPAPTESDQEDPARGTGAADQEPSDDRDSGWTEDAPPAQEPAQPREPVGAGATSTTTDLETVIGTTWVLRIGLGVLAISLALFARAVAPHLPAAAKVAVAYLGAGLLFGVGRFYEEKLERFARPVMAAGLTFGFFVAFAAHFVPAMAAVPLSISIIWMLASMGTVLVAAERWQSEATATLAIALGYVAGFVAIGEADAYSLAIIAFLALTSAILVLRHRWFSLGIAGLALAYATHFAWVVAGSDAPGGERGFYVNLGFLTAYYAVFLIADVLWWRRHRTDPEEQHPARGVSPRYLGPANLVLYVSLASFVYVTTGARVEAIEWFYVSLGALQAPLAWLYRDAHHRDYIFYPAFGTILWTMGMFAGFDALTLNLVLAAQALLLLVAAHRTRLWVFHALAQVALLVAFVHYWTYGTPPESTLPVFLGGLGLVAVYLVKASLEEIWYADGATPEWLSADGDDREPGLGERTFDRVFAPVAPMLAYVHAAVGGVVLIREAHAHFGWGGQLSVFVALSALTLVGLVLARRRTALLFALSLMAAACLAVVMARLETAPDPAAWWPDTRSALVLILGFSLAAVGLAAGASRRLESPRLGEAVSHGQVVLALTLGAAAIASVPFGLSFPVDIVWLAIPIAAIAFQDMMPEPQVTQGAEEPAGGEATNEPAGAEGAQDTASRALSASSVISLGAALLMLRLVTLGVGVSAPGLVWTAALTTVLFGWAWRLRSEAAGLAAYTLMMVGYPALLVSPDVLSELVASPLSGIWVTIVPMAAALTMDALREDVDGTTSVDARDQATLGAYALAIVVLSGFAALQLSIGWWHLVPALVALALVILSRRAPLTLAMASGMGALVGLHGWFLLVNMQSGSSRDALLPLILFGIVTLAAHRRADDLAARKPGKNFADIVGTVLPLAATTTMMAAIYFSTLFGALWATAGWAILGGSLMVAGFALRSSLYRRTALVVLAISLARVFLVDIGALSATAKTGVFFVLGLSLVGVGWLYSKYADRIKEWL